MPIEKLEKNAIQFSGKFKIDDKNPKRVMPMKGSSIYDSQEIGDKVNELIEAHNKLEEEISGLKFQQGCEHRFIWNGDGLDKCSICGFKQQSKENND